MVERRLKEALKNDRARIQIGHISHFGLMEMSRQRLRPSLAETSFIACPHCGGTGHVRSARRAPPSTCCAAIEEEGAKRRAAEIVVYAAPAVALYILNHKRERLAEIEQRYGMRVLCLGDDSQMTSQFRIERVRAQAPVEAPVAVTQEVTPAPEIEAEDEAVDAADEEDEVEDDAGRGRGGRDAGGGRASAPPPSPPAGRPTRGCRRRRRPRQQPAAEGAAQGEEPEAADLHVEGVPEHAETSDEDGRARRRGRRGGRRRRPDGKAEVSPHAEPGADQPDLPPVYSGPTPANPFGGHTFDIFDVMEQVEAAAPRGRCAGDAGAGFGGHPGRARAGV